MMKWILGKHGWIVPAIIFLLFFFAVLYLDAAREQRQEGARRSAAAVADRRAGLLADELGNAVGRHIGALTAAKLKFTPVDDVMSDQAFSAAVDTVIGALGGLTALSVIDPATAVISLGAGATLGRPGLNPFTDTIVANPLRRAIASGQPTATGLLDITGRRVIVFDPVLRGDTVLGVLAGELDPSQVLRVALSAIPTDSLRGVFYALHGPAGDRITAVPSPADWPQVDRAVRVADTEWHIRLAYPPLNPLVFRAERVALWAAGLGFGLVVAGLLLLMRGYHLRQREEIGRRRSAEEAARRSADEARQRATEARELAVQLGSAQRTAQRLSTSLDPDDVVELFLGSVAEITDADVASLYTFEEDGELLVGRRRVVFRDVGPETDRLKAEDIRQVRAPAALLPGLAEAVATGEPAVTESAPKGAGVAVSHSGDSAASLTIPLMVAGHMVGVASWDVYGAARRFSPGTIAFAQALAAPAAAALRTAELFTSLELARSRATGEALRFGTVLDQMADGVVVVDNAGRVERSNRAAEELLGPEIAAVPLEEWATTFRVTTTDGRTFPPQDFPLVRALRGERVQRTHLIVRSAGGVERFLSVSAGPILSARGEPTGAALVFRDVTDEHQYAEMLRHTNRELRQQAEVLERVNQQLRDATKAKDQFLAVMSHELRTPINAIMGYSDLLDLGVKGDLNPDQRTMITRVRDTSRHLLGLINEILDLAKIGSGQVDLALAEVDVSDVVRRAAEQILPLATAKGLTLTVDVEGAEGRPLLVLADETRLAQIVINLLSNAVKFTQTGEVAARCARLDNRIQIRVRDTGPGIPETERERIFDEFYQVESGLSRNVGGTGLGLAIARRFARLMGGDIRVESEHGKGSEFTIELDAIGPLSPAAGKDLPAVVLLGANEEFIARADAAVDGHVRVIATTDAGRVAGLARQEHPRLIVLDVAVPDLGVWRALGALQADGATAPIPTLLVVHDGREPNRVLDLGFFTTLTKPLVVQRAVDAIIASASGSSHPVILVADDDPDVRRILADALAAAGCAVETAASGPQAVRTMAAVPPDVAVLDLLTPHLTGPGLLARIRGNPDLEGTAVVMLGARELTGAQMLELHESTTRLAHAREGRRLALGELLSGALVRALDTVPSGV
jgi:PAS domain S-box-containing protein